MNNTNDNNQGHKVNKKDITVIITIAVLSLFTLISMGVVIYVVMSNEVEDREKMCWLAIGDSITVGENDGGYAEYIAKDKNIVFEKRCWGGIGIRELNNLTEQNFLEGVNNPELVTVFIGTNDFGFDTPMEEFEESLDRYITDLKERFPKARIVFLTPLYRDYFGNTIPTVRGTVNNLNYTLYDYRDKIIAASNTHNIEAIDLTNDKYLNPSNIHLLSSDGLHPNKKGYQMIAKKLSVALGI